jgi:hypothetical protein
MGVGDMWLRHETDTTIFFVTNAEDIVYTVGLPPLPPTPIIQKPFNVSDLSSKMPEVFDSRQVMINIHTTEDLSLQSDTESPYITRKRSPTRL